MAVADTVRHIPLSSYVVGHVIRQSIIFKFSVRPTAERVSAFVAKQEDSNKHRGQWFPDDIGHRISNVPERWTKVG